MTVSEGSHWKEIREKVILTSKSGVMLCELLQSGDESRETLDAVRMLLKFVFPFIRGKLKFASALA